MLFFSFIFLLFSAFFSSAETAFTSLSELQLQVIYSKHRISAWIIRYLQKKLNVFISTILIGNTIANVMFSVFITQYTLSAFNNTILAYVTGGIILVMLILGEITPKQLALQYNKQFVTVSAIPLFIFYMIFFPLAKILSFFSFVIQSILSHKNKTALTDSISNEHLISFFNAVNVSQLIPHKQKKLLKRMLSLSNISVENIMTHRKHVFALSAHLNIKESKILVKNYTYSHIPVYANQDNEQIIGIVSIRDIIECKHTKDNTIINDIIKNVSIISKSESLENTLSLFKQKQQSFAVVIDEYGGLSGIITFNDIASHVLDFSIEQKNPPPPPIIPQSNTKNRFLVNTSIALSDIEDILNIRIHPRPKSHTIGGYLTEYLGYFPSHGENITHDMLGSFKVLNVQQDKIVSVMWSKPENPTPSSS